ncbi:MAG: hypothetical protein LBK99_25700 [Opitutaceae bacterium]|jgi:hypothetical protein|nr:hypothetical protein [Opitutaceae bacterium]
MSREQTIATWMSFTLNTLRRASGLPLPEFVGFLKKYGIIRFLADNYELTLRGSTVGASLAKPSRT